MVSEDDRLPSVDHLVYAPVPGRPAASRLLSLLRAVPGGTTLWCVTRGLSALETASLRGISRVAASEQPESWGGLVDLVDDDAASLARWLGSGSREPVVSVEDGVVSAQRLVPLATEPGVFRCRPDGTYLITGGLGALGLQVAEHLAQRGARRIILLGRKDLGPRERWDGDERAEAVRALEAAGVTVVVVAADIADATAVTAALDGLDLPPIRGVVHAAGTVDSTLLHDLDDETLRAVMRPKLSGALVLDELFPPGSLDFLVFFSSIGQWLGLPGQGAYAAANAALDALAHRRRDAGGTETVSIAWTSWRGLGMSTSAAATDLELAARGTGDIDASRAFRLLDQILAAPDSVPPVVGVVRILHGHQGHRPAVLADLPQDEPGDIEEKPEWDSLSGPELTGFLQSAVQDRVAAVLGGAPGGVALTRPLAEAGVDSLLATVLRLELEKVVRVALPATLLWNHPTIADITRYLAGLVSSGLGRQG
ncbi:beta-ketoacyl reductase [Amycolatopsis sp. EV170708-02-1]|uniref:beta-ketoacyl reductase n=1 Tax=Amycolatopsis sp. EV170708-02-1 TaxID=2919322 RepID=UPI001F0BA265|nr:beta-ketoacyl reductase [Amycolatopsis sp. EV170708-02-1]UMP07614.1 beta-ketoacyl reductase [Amycolatopsis sp. EV170708-02-1]